MPTGGSSGEYLALYTAYSSDDTNFRNALSTPLSGDIFSSSDVEDQGTIGNFWSSTRSVNAGMNRLFVVADDIGPTLNASRYAGFSMRCLLDS